MEEHFDVVVVGSGFGASAAACRLAQAGRSVLVLERGRSYPPGSFPAQPPRPGAEPVGTVLRAVRDVRRVGVPRHRVRGVAAASAAARSSTPTSCSARTRPGSSTTPPASPPRPWPVSYADLEPHYESAEAMLGAQRYPFDVAPYSATAKTEATCVRRLPLGLDWQLPPLAVSFASPGQPPAPGSPSSRSTLTCTACLALPAACAASATSVATTAPRTPSTTPTSPGPSTPGRRSAPCARCAGSSPHRSPAATRPVTYAPTRALTGGAGGPARASTSPCTADHLVIGAGTFGSTYLLLRNRAAFPASVPPWAPGSPATAIS